MPFDPTFEYSRTTFTDEGLDALTKHLALLPLYASVWGGDTKMSEFVQIPLVGDGYRVAVDTNVLTFPMLVSGSPTHIVITIGNAVDSVALAVISTFRDIDGDFAVGDTLTWDTCGKSALFSLDGWVK